MLFTWSQGCPDCEEPIIMLPQSGYDIKYLRVALLFHLLAHAYNQSTNYGMELKYSIVSICVHGISN